MSVIVHREILIGEQADFRYVRVFRWQPACGCVLATLTHEHVIIYPRPGERIWRIPRPLAGTLEAVCSRHGHEHRLMETDVRLILHGDLARVS